MEKSKGSCVKGHGREVSGKGFEEQAKRVWAL